jgi:DNA-directed RNA polymerase subunit RPC12/RpoP
MSQEQINMNISLDKTTGVACTKCKHMVFQEGVILRKASRFITGTAQDALIPISVFTCINCGHVNEEFLPTQLRKNEDNAL